MTTIQAYPTRRVRYEGRDYDIPEIWLVGCTTMARREGLSFEDAYIHAIATWAEQTQLAEAWEAERS